MMKQSLKFLAVILMGMAALACSSVTKMAEKANTVSVKCEPAQLAVVDGQVNAKLTFNFPKGYFNPKAVLAITPVLVYQGGEAKAKTIKFEGTKVKDNFFTISKDGQTVTRNISFKYVKGMEKAVLELRSVASKGSKSVSLPVRKVAEGCNTLYMIANRGVICLLPDNYQLVIPQTEEAQIKYLINSSVVRRSQLRSKGLKEFKANLKALKNDDRRTLQSVRVIAYASPDGGVKYNDKLSDRRAVSADKVFKNISKGDKIKVFSVKSVGEDWNGFKSLVQKSNMQDKDLVLRVLSMYSNPAVREKEIKNMSEVYTVLKKTVLPELRRAKFVANIDFRNYSNQELLDLIAKNVNLLSEPALLHVATLVKDNDAKITLYKKAIEKYNSNTARYNLAALLVNLHRSAEASKLLESIPNVSPNVENAFGVLALHNGDLAAASRLFEKSNTPEARRNLAAIDILTGKYAEAESILRGTGTENEALVLILLNKPEQASAVLSKLSSPKASYLKAVLAARAKDASVVSEELNKAAQDPALRDRMQNDIEFSNYKLLVK